MFAFKQLIQNRRQNADPDKGVAFRYNFVAAYPKSVKNSPQIRQLKIQILQTSLHDAAFGNKH